MEVVGAAVTDKELSHIPVASATEAMLIKPVQERHRRGWGDRDQKGKSLALE